MLLPNGIRISTDRPQQGCHAALFLDRDGVLVEERDYLSDPRDVRLEKGVPDLIRRARTHGLAVAVITNQSGIGRGFFGWNEYEAVEAEIARQLHLKGVSLDLVIACPYKPEALLDAEQARWRKPGPAMIEYAGRMLGVELAASWMVGDKASDIEAARNAGLAGAVHVLTGHGCDEGERDTALLLADAAFNVLTAADPDEAARKLGSYAFPAKD